jgi:hypothetical protein
MSVGHGEFLVNHDELNLIWAQIVTNVLNLWNFVKLYYRKKHQEMTNIQPTNNIQKCKCQNGVAKECTHWKEQKSNMGLIHFIYSMKQIT